MHGSISPDIMSALGHKRTFARQWLLTREDLLFAAGHDESSLTQSTWPQSSQRKKCTGDPVVGFSTIALNCIVPPQRGQGLWSILIGSTASSYAQGRGTRSTIHHAAQDDYVTIGLYIVATSKEHNVPPSVAIKVIRRRLIVRRSWLTRMNVATVSAPENVVSTVKGTNFLSTDCAR